MSVPTRIDGRERGEYRVYRTMLQRCNNPLHAGFAYYGGRGIQVLYASFEDFICDVGCRPPRHWIDRIETNGHYEQGNCRWVTPAEQQRNRRDNVFDPAKVLAARAMYAAGQTFTDIGRAMAIPKGTVRAVALRQTWRDI